MSNALNDGRMDYIEFGTTHLGESKHFFSTTFGWTFKDYGDDYASFEDGRLAGGFSTEVTPGASPVVVLYANDLEDTLAKVKANGGTIVRQIFDFPGGRRFHFVEPGGSELGVWSDH